MDPNEARRRAIEHTARMMSSGVTPPRGNSNSTADPSTVSVPAARTLSFDPVQLPQILANAIAVVDRARSARGEVVSSGPEVAPEPYRYSILSPEREYVISLLGNPAPRIYQNVLDPHVEILPEIIATAIASGELQANITRARENESRQRVSDGSATLVAETESIESLRNTSSVVGDTASERVVLIRSRVDRRQTNREQYFHVGLNEWRDFQAQAFDGGMEDDEDDAQQRSQRIRDRIRKRFRSVIAAANILKKRDGNDDDDINGAIGSLNISLPVAGSLRRF